MECVEATRALKSSFLSQMTNSEVLSNDDLWCFTRTGTVSEDFPVEDLLNLDGDFFEDDEVKPEEVMKFSSSGSDSLSSTDEFDGFSAGGGGLSVPFEDLENLEWLSQFVDSEPSLCGLTADVGVSPLAVVNRPAKQLPCFSFKVRKARSKRQRSSGSQWSTEDSTVTAESMSSYGSSTLCPSVEKPSPPAKNLKRKAEAESGFISGRRCTHCHVQKTPQWRSGPLGPKTLCNACGVRFKSGRLFPEYRPACSPTFSQQMHSNSHRKVLEMRRKKETETIVEEPIGLVSN